MGKIMKIPIFPIILTDFVSVLLLFSLSLQLKKQTTITIKSVSIWLLTFLKNAPNGW